MKTDSKKVAAARLCADVSLSQGEAIEGSAGHYDHFVMIEVPLPWERDVWSSRHGLRDVNEVIQEAGSRGIRARAQGLVPREGQAGQGLTVIHYAHQLPTASEFRRQEYRVSRAQVAPLIRSLLFADAK